MQIVKTPQKPDSCQLHCYPNITRRARAISIASRKRQHWLWVNGHRVPHPDDETLGCGVCCLNLPRAVSPQSSVDDERLALPSKTHVRIRYEKARRSARGVKQSTPSLHLESPPNAATFLRYGGWRELPQTLHPSLWPNRLGRLRDLFNIELEAKHPFWAMADEIPMDDHQSHLHRWRSTCRWLG